MKHLVPFNRRLLVEKTGQTWHRFPIAKVITVCPGSEPFVGREVAFKEAFAEELGGGELLLEEAGIVGWMVD